jgi:hypothetical protein
LSCFIPPSQLSPKDKKEVERWVEGYRDMLDSWGMFTARSSFDVLRLERQKGLGADVREKKSICPA